MISKLCPLYDETRLCGLASFAIGILAAITLPWVIGYLGVMLLPGLAVFLLLGLFARTLDE